MQAPSIEELYGAASWRILRWPEIGDVKWSAFNPSISYSPEEGYVVLFRSSNYFLSPETTGAVLTEGAWVKSRMWLGNLSSNWDLVPGTLREIDFSEAGIYLKRGAEDGRLYWVDGAWEFTAGLKEPSIPFPRIGRFRLNGLKASLIEIYEDGNLYDVEKNWVTSANRKSQFDFIYNPRSVYEVGVGPVEVREPLNSLKLVRGGSQLWWLEGWGYLSVAHEVSQKKVNIYVPRYFCHKDITVRSYTHRFVRYNESGAITGLSPVFKLSDARIEFAAGLIVSKEEVIVSYGYKDVSAYLAKFDLKKVLESIQDAG